MVWADDFGFDRDERIALAEFLLRRDITSWTQLTEPEICRLLDAFEGASLIANLINQRATPPAQPPPSRDTETALR